MINKGICNRISSALSLFHQHKQAILDVGARRGKNDVIDNWHIPKLELFQVLYRLFISTEHLTNGLQILLNMHI
jgi:hypothetical protein